MGKWSYLDTDEERLPEGMVRIGYDADEQVYTYRDGKGSIWEGAPGNEYGRLRRKRNEVPPLPSFTSAPTQPAISDSDDDEHNDEKHVLHDFYGDDAASSDDASDVIATPKKAMLSRLKSVTAAKGRTRGSRRLPSLRNAVENGSDEKDFRDNQNFLGDQDFLDDKDILNDQDFLGDKKSKDDDDNDDDDSNTSPDLEKPAVVEKEASPPKGEEHRHRRREERRKKESAVGLGRSKTLSRISRLIRGGNSNGEEGPLGRSKTVRARGPRAEESSSGDADVPAPRKRAMTFDDILS